MTSVEWFYALLLVVAVERVAELVVSTRNARWSLAQGGLETGRGHYPWMVLLHLGLFIGCLAEVRHGRDFVPVLGFAAVSVVVMSQALRWWCIATLGRHWNTRVIVVPGFARVTAGPYRWLRHPNYVAVVAEGLALPLVHSVWITALCFTVLNFWLLKVRLSVEEHALSRLHVCSPSSA